MNLTRHNISELLPFVKKSIKECDFLAIDFEMTGISKN